MLEHAGLQIDALDVGGRQVVVEVVFVEGEVNCSAVHTAVGSKKTVVVVVAVVVVVETGSSSKVVGSKLVQIPSAGHNLATIHALRIKVRLQQLELHFPSRTGSSPWWKPFPPSTGGDT